MSDGGYILALAESRGLGKRSVERCRGSFLVLDLDLESSIGEEDFAPARAEENLFLPRAGERLPASLSAALIFPLHVRDIIVLDVDSADVDDVKSRGSSISEGSVNQTRVHRWKDTKGVVCHSQEAGHSVLVTRLTRSKVSSTPSRCGRG